MNLLKSLRKEASMNKMEDLYPLILDAFSKDLAFTFPIHGTSMLPLLRTNDLVTLKKIDRPLKVGDIVLFRRFDGSFVLHRIRYISDNQYTIVGDHQRPLERNVSENQMIGYVMSYTKKDKVHNKKGLRYRIYKCLVKSSFIRGIFGRLYK